LFALLSDFYLNPTKPAVKTEEEELDLMMVWGEKFRSRGAMHCALTECRDVAGNVSRLEFRRDLSGRVLPVLLSSNC
jgi:hypothetical protein